MYVCFRNRLITVSTAVYIPLHRYGTQWATLLRSLGTYFSLLLYNEPQSCHFRDIRLSGKYVTNLLV
jgi:hypothetical protein